MYLFSAYEVLFACIYVCVPCVCSAHIGQKRAIDPAELQSQSISHHVGAGNGNQVLFKSNTHVLITAEPSLKPPRFGFT